MSQSIQLLAKAFLSTLLIFTLFLKESQCFTSPASCASTRQFYNYLTHACQTCPNFATGVTNTASDIAYCNCSSSYYPNPDSIGFRHSSSCLTLGSTLGASQVALIYSRSGARQTTPIVTTCSANSYPNTQKTDCIPCGYNMIYSSSLKICICSGTDDYPIGSFCVNGVGIGNPFTVSSLENRILWGIANLGCRTLNPSKQACQILLNKCAQSGYRSTDFFCTLLATKVTSGIMKGYTSSEADLNTQSLGIFASSVLGTDSTTVKNKLSFVVLQYDKFGQLRDIKPFGTEILPCIATQEDASQFQSFGLNLVKTCLATDIQTKTVSYWDIYVLDSQSRYVEVMTVYDTGATYYKRYYKNDYNSIQITYRSVPPLSVPYIALSQKGTPDITTTSKTDVINLVVTGPFIAFNVVSLLLFLISFYKYMKYNPYNEQDPYIFFKVIFIFFLKAMRHWGITLWIWLFGVSAYCFCFYKFQQTVYLLLPDTVTQWLAYYEPFMIVFYIQFGFVFFSVILLIYDLGSATDYFIVDWEKQKDLTDEDIKQVRNRRPISVWRRILLVNELYQLTVTQLLDWSLIIAFGIFFLEGLKWIKLSYQIPNVNNLDKDFSSSSKKNVVLAYFIITFIFFIVGIIQYILRHIFKTWYPLPYENYIDLCCISNNSVIIFDHQLHGYYIHGMNPLGQAEGTLKYLQSVFQKQAKSFGKSRAFKNNDPDQTQVFQVIYPKLIRDAFTISYKNRCMEKLISRAADTSILANPIPQTLQQGDYKQLQGIQNGMVETFKYYLEGVKTSQFNIREQSFIQRVLSCPIDSDVMGRLPIFFKDFWHKFTQVLLSGHEILLLINLINFINIFYIATSSVVVACFISLIICKFVIKNLADFFIKRNISRNTLIDDRFFS